MTATTFLALLKKQFPFEPTLSQQEWFHAITDFFYAASSQKAFVLTGYAGTGKSTIIGFLVNVLNHTGYKAVLMAPTGRAAKVISSYSKRPSYTIHKQIYFPKSDTKGGVSFKLKENKYKKTVFIIDEASMIGDDRQQSKLFENGSLLNDVVQYVLGGDQCKLIFVGDPAQLPPVNLEISPALDVDELEHQYFDEVSAVRLETVVRQAEDSGILYNATHLREQLTLAVFDQFQFKLDGFADIIRMQDGQELFIAIEDSFSENGTDQTVFIVRSNKRANLYNENIRKRILMLEEELSVGDQLMVVKNNYFWLSPDSKPGFIANGDVIEIRAIYAYKSLYEHSFAEVRVALVDYPNEKEFDTVLLLDTLKSNTASLSFEEGNALYRSVLEDYSGEKSKYKKFLKVKKNPFFNALQVKYSYAITCHKSQGGQWNAVFVEHPYLPEGPDKDYFRWLYTALTRAKEKLYLIGFPSTYFEET